MSKDQNVMYLFECSWEVCNKVGGIYTVVSTKVSNMEKIFGENYFLIGPDVWKGKDNKDFIEDKNLFLEWRHYAESQGISLRLGRWDIEGSPKVVLVDFKSLIAKKDEILAEFWTAYKLDSLSGYWDYVEPVLFGYASARVIESFYNFYLYPNEMMYAHFHEWMTGAGILYLKKHLPAVATIFTTHATVLGRCIAGNSLPLYSELKNYDGEDLANRFEVKSKFSMEKISALQADAFTTVSEITNAECAQFFGKEVDVVTPNGFDDAFVPQGEAYDTARKVARGKLLNVTTALLNQKIEEDALFVINSGRYEFKNKGIDLYIDSLAKLNQSEKLTKQVIAYLTIPADSLGVRQDLMMRMKEPDFSQPKMDDFCTHYLNNADNDPIIQRLRLVGLRNNPEDRVKIVFVPCYLDGHDGVFNLSYYDLLIGFDVSVFPSYYEPWGYTPLESIAFSIPTVTTSLSGFGQWVDAAYTTKQKGVAVIQRTDNNDFDVIVQMADYLLEIALCSPEDMQVYRKSAKQVSRIALWDKMVMYYQVAFSKAAEKWKGDRALLNKQMPISALHFPTIKPNMPDWKKIIVVSQLPEELSKLKEIASNLWWSWNYLAEDLFESIDAEAWGKCQHNPIALIDSLTNTELADLIQNKDFMQRLSSVYDSFRAYMDTPKETEQPGIAYFSMEFGLHESLKIYSGGLGILAGDYLKAASDKNVNMVGVGLLYRYGYFNQVISNSGEQIAEVLPQSFSKLPLLPELDEDGQWKKITLSLPGRKLHAKIWRVDVGRVPLYLLDTDIEDNSELDRSITHQLYGGDWENRFKQELLLGIGGIRLLRKVGVQSTVYHCNEGHAAFIGIERIKEYIERDNMTFWQAKEMVRSSSLFTTHTPVPAGHDEFTEDIVRTYISHYPHRLKIPWDVFMGLGRLDASRVHDKFSMSLLAANLSQEINGVSKIHGRVSREILSGLYPGYFPEELHIGYVTNGVHYKTWTNSLWQRFYEKTLGLDFLNDISDAKNWQNIQKASSSEIWAIRNKLRGDLLRFVKRKLQMELARKALSPHTVVKIVETLKENTLTIGFARRFATYKRAHLVFRDLERLKKIVNHPERPVQFIFAGKAHPADKAGQDLIKYITEVAKKPDFLGKIVFLENYDVDIAQKMVQGVDVWLNNPTRPLEASGTSGEKAIMNGVLNLSVLDGWWAEGYKENAGWALKEEKTYENQSFQDELDAETIYQLIENQIAPAFYEASPNGVPEKWVGFIKNNITEIVPHFTMRRQLDDYYNQYYLKLHERFMLLSENHASCAIDLASWKLKIMSMWGGIHLVSSTWSDTSNKPLLMGETASFSLVLDIQNLKPEEIGVEIIFGQKKNDMVQSIFSKYSLQPVAKEGSLVTYKCDLTADVSGVFDFACRVFPQNPLLAHRQDFPLVKWV